MSCQIVRRLEYLFFEKYVIPHKSAPQESVDTQDTILSM